MMGRDDSTYHPPCRSGIRSSQRSAVLTNASSCAPPSAVALRPHESSRSKCRGTPKEKTPHLILPDPPVHSYLILGAPAERCWRRWCQPQRRHLAVPQTRGQRVLRRVASAIQHPTIPGRSRRPDLDGGHAAIRIPGKPWSGTGADLDAHFLVVSTGDDTRMRCRNSSGRRAEPDRELVGIALSSFLRQGVTRNF
jgi:hypothetical protein